MKMKQLALTAVCGIALTGCVAAGAQVVVRIGPPPPRPVEVIPPVPHEHPNWAWHAGYHRWDGHGYVWVPGRFEEPPYRGARWVDGHWAHRGGGYVWIEGHWRR
jgi:hypothetical protein